MRRLTQLAVWVLLATAPSLAQETAGAPGAHPPDPNSASDGLMSRIDFGNAYVMGQTIQSGAVYLLNRKQSEIHSMLECREDYRREIREDAEVLDSAHRR